MRLRWHFSKVIALAFSGGKDSMACLHLMRDELECAIWVDTGFAYPETERLVDYAETILPVHRVRSDRHSQNESNGIPSDIVPIDWTALGQLVSGPKSVMVQSYFDCCFANIAVPLMAKAKELGVTQLVCGQRNDERHKATSRHGQMVEGVTRLQPIEDWTQSEVLSYLATKMDVPEHYAIKHSSLDCFDCPAYRAESADRVDWTRSKYPDFYRAYELRAMAIDGALLEALGR